MRGILDTWCSSPPSKARDLDRLRLPDEAAVSVVTLAEPKFGVQVATSEATRAQRLRTLNAELVAIARRAGYRPKVHESWIAATANADRARLSPGRRF